MITKDQQIRNTEKELLNLKQQVREMKSALKSVHASMEQNDSGDFIEYGEDLQQIVLHAIRLGEGDE